MATLTLILPPAPSVNTYWRSIVRKGSTHASVIISERGREYRQEVIARCMMPTVMKWAQDHYGKPLRMELHSYPPDKRNRDLDNAFKSVGDSLVHAKVLRDDSDIWHISNTRMTLSEPPGRLVVRLSPFDLGSIGQ